MNDNDGRTFNYERVRMMSMPELNVFCNTLQKLREPNGQYSFRMAGIINAIKYALWDICTQRYK